MQIYFLQWAVALNAQRTLLAKLLFLVAKMWFQAYYYNELSSNRYGVSFKASLLKNIYCIHHVKLHNFYSFLI